MAKVLISNIALPTATIGSWTTRMSRFVIENPNFFKYILSPNKSLNTSVFCQKRAFITWKKPLRKLQLRHWVASDYIKQIKKIAIKYDKLVIVVMDDSHLVEAISLIKHGLKCEIELVFSFHGFNLTLDSKIITSIDKILWLSKLASDKNKLKYHNFPESYVIGNAIDSKIFFPLDAEKFITNRAKKGYSESDEILIWMANDRPKKGFHIFKSVAEQLLEEQTNLKVIIIGSTQTINHPNVSSVGRIPNSEVATYLQLGSYYMFTTLYEEGFGLSMIEALKCGNAVIASNLGAIPEVLKGLEQNYLIDEPEAINSWEDYFNLARTNSNFGKERLSKKNSGSIWNYEDWEAKFIDAV
ncbi:glycosyltransferase family 4 protein [Winogradskyella sp. UBA3174]|uniref:glycosyltransferase family 4 protein n=1 Tax=Winogradskyella sp. UBA3174 TaxID=1947785 RepID=UPI0025CE2549|nr:glycosyltransferase family 4 protein [Winogradskyella sp. UBA3174]